MNLDPELVSKLKALQLPTGKLARLLCVLSEHEPQRSQAAIRKQRERDQKRDMSRDKDVTCHATHTVTEDVTTPPPLPLSPQSPLSPAPPPPCPPPVCAEGAVNWAALKAHERLDWLERIAAAYGKRGKPQDVLGHIRHSIEVNGVDPAELLRCTEQATATIRQHAPQGFDSGRVPHAETFFAKEQWRNPTSFAGYWDTTRRGSAPEARTEREARAALADGNSSHTLNADSLFSEPPTRHP